MLKKKKSYYFIDVTRIFHDVITCICRLRLSSRQYIESYITQNNKCVICIKIRV